MVKIHLTFGVKTKTQSNFQNFSKAQSTFLDMIKT